MALYPEVQEKARAQLVSVLGQNTLPDHSNRRLLPYIEALIQEALRWHPVTPLGEF